MSNTPYSLKDLKIVYFKRSKGAGGQNVNKVATAVRITHMPTGIVVESTKERTQNANKSAALETLAEKLCAMEEEKIKAQQKEAYDNKPNTSFSAQIRTYRMCGNEQNVVDHRSGIKHNNVKAVLDGDIDKFLKGNSHGESGR